MSDTNPSSPDKLDSEGLGPWYDLDLVDAYPPGYQGMVSVKEQDIALFRLSSGEFYAVDNQCPHQGYPLAKGAVVNYQLTCCWHNFKFDLRTGACLKGDERVRNHMVRVHKGRVQVALCHEDPVQLRRRYRQELDEGVHELRLGQIARSVVRMVGLDVSPETLFGHAAVYDAERGEYGITHGPALAMDLLTLYKRYYLEDPLVPLMVMFDFLTHTHVRQAPRNRPKPIMPTEDPQTTGERILAGIENDEIDHSEARLRGAIRQGWGRPEVEPWFYELCTRHFFGFGHGLIFTEKVFNLLEIVGWEAAEELLSGLLYRMGYATREDILPEWAWFREATQALHPLFEVWFRGADEKRGLSAPEDFLCRVLDGHRTEALQAVTDELQVGVSPEAIIDGLSIAASERILRFDPRWDSDYTVEDDWLTVTHTLTFVHSVRAAFRRCPRPSMTMLLLFAARFINRTRTLDMTARTSETSSVRDHWTHETSVDHWGCHQKQVDQIVEATLARKPQEAMALGQRYFETGGSVEALEKKLCRILLSDHIVRPIIYAHTIKTAVAAFEELRTMRGHRVLYPHHPGLAALRLLASPIGERNTLRMLHEAKRLVVDGQVPKRLYI